MCVIWKKTDKKVTHTYESRSIFYHEENNVNNKYLVSCVVLTFRVFSHNITSFFEGHLSSGSVNY